MRRDSDLIRELMLKLEAIDKHPSAIVLIHPHDEEIAVEGYTVEQIAYHMDQIEQQDYFEGGRGGRPMEGWIFRSITPDGHDFIDTVRDPKVWKKTKEGASKVGGAAIGVLLEIGKAVARAELSKLGILPAA